MTTTTPDHLPGGGKMVGTQPDKPTPPPIVNVWLSVAMEIDAERRAREAAQKGGTE